MARALLILVWISIYGAVKAGPLVYFELEGRPAGSTVAFANNVDVEVGDVIEYRLRGQMAPDGTMNQRLQGSRAWPWEKHGINSLSISLVQDDTSEIQVDLATPIHFTPDSASGAGDGWGSGSFPRLGTPTFRSATAWNDLLDIRPIHGPGVFTAINEETIFTGVFAVASILGDIGLVNPKWGSISGGGTFHSEVFFITPPSYDTVFNVWHSGTELGDDPIAHFTPLVLTAASVVTVPEPSTLALCIIAVLGTIWLARLARR
jgi:hypothetical protein